MTGTTGAAPASAVRQLADEVHHARLAAHPFDATESSIPGYDHLVADLSLEGADRQREVLRSLVSRLDSLDVEALSTADRITWLTARNAAVSELTLLTNADVEHTVSVMHGEGAQAVLWIASQTRLTTAGDAANYLARCRAVPAYLEAHLARLRLGQEQGRLPVAALVAAVVEQIGGYLADTETDPLADVAAPAGWDGAEAWSDELRSVVAERVRPAIARWLEGVLALRTRPDDTPGLCALPGGDEDYRRLVALHTTLEVTALGVHAVGVAEVARLREEMAQLGTKLGLAGIDEVVTGFAISRMGVSAEDAMALARDAIARAEAAIVDVFPEPLPPPCRVAPMAVGFAEAGMPPHYTRPSPDGGVAGTFWFNASLPETGSGWVLASLSFHEAVPGHHLQLTRAALNTELSDLQRHGSVTAHSEGWGLYAEVLAGEIGLYPDTESELGALAGRLFRAARLVLDTGIHALGWSRDEAVAAFTAAVPLPPAFAEAEINRYIALPGQALSYMMGLREILRLRENAQALLGDRFALSGFHAAVLDSGSIPLPALALAVDTWVAELG